jgi:hypothetical protein
MISKGCKSLAEADFPIAEESRRATQECPAARQARAGETKRKRQEPINEPARFGWNDVTQVTRYYLSVDALTQPIQVREESPPDGEEKSLCLGTMV